MTAPGQGSAPPANADGEPGYGTMAEGLTRDWVTRTTAFAGGLLVAAGLLMALTGEVVAGMLAGLAGAVAFAAAIVVMTRRSRRRVHWMVLGGCWLLVAVGVIMLVTGS